VSFLFVVNELEIETDSPASNYDTAIRKDLWDNVLPPENPVFYKTETLSHVSHVMRFRNGEISAAGPAYRWVRPEQFGEGYIAVAAGGTEYALTKYKSTSVFSCNPSLPIVTYAGDARTLRDPEFHALQFLHPQSQSGIVSQATFPLDVFSPVGGPPAGSIERDPAKYVAGRHASWIPSLVPDVCRNRYLAGQSLGLSGELGIVIGLMAFHASKDGRTVNDVFLGRGESSGLWKNYRWRGTSSPPGCMLPFIPQMSPDLAAQHMANDFLIDPCSEHDTPRGHLVHICLDPENQSGSTESTLSMLEWNSVLVQG
jgi:hypothetical protein